MSSNMVVQTNVLALNAHRNLKTVGIKQEKASQRLSSGYRINSAADDAAGLAISEKMRAQIRGLDMASKNAQDGISLVQTAEGGMQEIDNMAQRIRELVVQASNDTNDFDTEDRTKIQEEIDQLIEEIDSMSERVEFNAKKLLNGDYADPATQLKTLTKQHTKLAKAYADAQTLTGKLAQDVTDAGTAKGTAQTDLATEAAKVATDPLFLAIGTAQTNASGKEADLTTALNAINTYGGTMTTANATLMQDILAAYNDLNSTSLDPTDFEKDIAAWATFFTDVATAINSGVSGQPLFDAIEDLVVTQGGGTMAALDTAFATLAATAGTSITDLQGAGTGSYKAIEDAKDAFYATTAGAEYKVAEDALAKATADENTAIAAHGQAVLDEADALKARDDMKAAVDALDAAITAGTAGDGGLWFQVGANSEQGIRVGISAINTLQMGIGNGDGTTDDINVDIADGQAISRILDTLDEALSFISSERSRLGAVQNRLEYTMNSLDISAENLSAAESRIRDTDMAKEMMNLTKANVLQQAATAMLAQANQAPNSILQLLG